MELTLKEHDYNLYMGVMISLAMKESRYSDARLWGYAYKTMYQWLTAEINSKYWYARKKGLEDEKELKCIINDKQRSLRAITEFGVYVTTKDTEVAKGLLRIENLIKKG